MSDNLLDTIEAQGVTLSLEPGNRLMLAIDQHLNAYPDTALTPALSDTIKANKPELIKLIRARAHTQARHRADAARLQAEKMRAIDLRRQGLAKCQNCLYAEPYPFDDLINGKDEKQITLHCRNIHAMNAHDHKANRFDYWCSEYLPMPEK